MIDLVSMAGPDASKRYKLFIPFLPGLTHRVNPERPAADLCADPMAGVVPALRLVPQAGHESVTVRLKNGVFLLHLTFMHANEETVVSRDGLRFTSKTNGSPFQGMGYSGETLSCIRCSQHKPRRHGAFRRHPCGLFFICHDCKPPVKN